MAGTHISRRSYFLVDYPDVYLDTMRHLPLTNRWPIGQGESVGTLTIYVGLTPPALWHCTSANINIRNVHRSKAVTDLRHNILGVICRDSR